MIIYFVIILTTYAIYLYNNWDLTLLTVFILTHPVNFPCGRKPEHPEKTHDFRQSVGWLFSHEWNDDRTHDLKGERRLLSEDCANEALLNFIGEKLCSNQKLNYIRTYTSNSIKIIHKRIKIDYKLSYV
jgi:hypothetical protein